MIRIIDASSVPVDEIVKRKEHSQPDVSAAVTEIIYNVRRRGDAALRDYTLRFDGADVAELRVSDEEIERAKKTVDAEFLKVLETAAENIREYHSRQIREGFTVNRENGVVMGQRVMPLERVGVYIPGGTAAYPSTALMDIIPAKIAGVSEVIMLTPPRADGSVDDGILAAAATAGADKI